MILQETTTNVEQIGEFTEQAQFKIKASKKAFALLSGLYSDIPLAIVRELAINSLDAHVVAGKQNVPIEIHLPNALEPWLTIKDFGTGISHKDIYDIYTTYFESTKTSTNDQVGCFGIGGKTQLTYTDTFTTTSITAGVKRTYNVFFNKDGVPCISLVHQNNTDECNGLEVQIPVKSTDFDKFKDATYRACKFFDVKPTIIGGKIDWNLEKADFQGSFWQSYHNLNSSFAVMGKVAYPIDTYKLNGENYDIARKAGLVINFELGELEITPAREALIYSEHTLKNLNAKIELVKSDFVEKVEDTIKNSPNLLDAMKALFNLNNKWSFLNSKLVSGKVMWNKIDISDPRRSIQPFAPNLVSIAKSWYGRRKYSESTLASLDNNSIWYVDDLPKGGHKRVLLFLRNNQDKITINLVSPKEMAELVNAGFPSDIFKKTSDLPKPIINKTSSNGVRIQGVFNIYNQGGSWKNTWESQQFDVSKDTAPKYYIVKNSEGWEFDGGMIKDSNGKGILKAHNKETLKEILDFLGINQQDVKMVSLTNAKHLVTLGSKSLKELIESKSVSYDEEKTSLQNEINKNAVESIVKNFNFKSLPEENDFKKFILGLKEILDYKNPLKNLVKYVQIPENKGLTFPSKMVELLYVSLENWRVDQSLVAKAAKEIK